MKKRIVSIIFAVLMMLLAAPAIMGAVDSVDLDGSLNLIFTADAAHKHKYTSKVTKKATCTKTGVRTYTCKCGDSYTKKIAATGHKSTKTVKAKAATCTKAGYTKGVYCNNCKTYISGHKTVKALGHKYSSKYTTDKKATCVKAGSKSKHCTRDDCTAKKSVTTIKKLGHKYTNACDKTCNTCKATRTIKHDYAAATCTDPKTCKVCETTSGKALGHKEATYKAVEATCTKSGRTEGKYCSVCGTVTVVQKIVAAKGHTIVTDKAVDATCEKAGKTEGKHCSVCETVTVAQTTVPAGHKAVVDDAVAATCVKSGKTAGSHCSVCNTVITAQKTVAAKGHQFKVTNPAMATKCSASGCSEQMPAFNNIVNNLKASADGLNYFTSLLKDQNDYKKTELSGMMAGSMGEEEVPASETDYSLIVNRPVTNTLFPTKGEAFVSALTASDVNSIKAQKMSGIDFVSELPSSFNIGKYSYDISSIKSAKFPDVYKISITLPGVSVDDITKKISGSSVYDRIYTKNYKGVLEELRIEMLSQITSLEQEMAPLKDIIKMKTSGSIKSGLTVDYYVTTDDYTPVAAKYALKFDVVLNIKVTDKIGLLNYITMKQPMSTTSTSYYFFNESFGL